VSRSKAEICADLEALAQERGFIYSLAVLLAQDLMFDVREAGRIDWHARLSYQEFSFIGGLMVKNAVDLQRPTEAEMRARMERTRTLFKELHAAHGAVVLDRLKAQLERTSDLEPRFEKHTRELFGAGEAMTEPIFYSGSGAYDFQYWTLAPRRYELDNEWLLREVGLEWDGAGELARALKGIRRRPEKVPSTFEEFADAMLDSFCVSPADVDVRTADEVTAFFGAFSLEPGTVNADLAEPGQYNRLDSHPLILLSDGRYFLAVQFNLARSLYESPFYWMLTDAAYRDQASVHRGETMEALAAEFLSAVFASENVHRGVELRRGSTVVGEIDVLATLGRKGLIVQCKSKRLTELARRGDTDALERDFQDAVQAAYEQGLSCRELLTDDSVAAYVEETQIDVDIDDAFIACVVSDHYPSLAHQVHMYLKRDADAPYPFVLSIFDLELVSYYLDDPFGFMYYVRQRTSLAELFRADEEMALLAYHLRSKLFSDASADLIGIDSGMAQLIDAHYPGARGEQPEVEGAADELFHGWRNEHHDQLLEDLKNSGEPGFVDAVFMLFDFAGDSFDALVQQLLAAKDLTRRDGKEHSIATYSEDSNAGISFLTRSEDRQALSDRTLRYAHVKKYQTRANEWLGLGSLAGSDRLADVAVYSNAPWAYDGAVEAEVARIAGHGTARRMTPKLGRNDPCHCGSGLKYKQCHGR
jgi:hypothetical protein